MLDTTRSVASALFPINTLVPPSSSLRVIQDGAGYGYLISTPASAGGDVDAGTLFPLLLFLHGVSERGAHVPDVMRQAVPRLISGRADLSPEESAIGRSVAERFIVVAPQCPARDIWEESPLLALLDRLLREHPIDSTRVYVSGLSMGGFGAWGLAMRHPERFAALVAVCGGGRVRDINAAAPERLAALRSLGVWAFHGALDRVVPLEESERMIAALQAAGVSEAKLTVYPDIAHDAWTRAYLNPDVYAWLLRHARVPE